MLPETETILAIGLVPEVPAGRVNAVSCNPLRCPRSKKKHYLVLQWSPCKNDLTLHLSCKYLANRVQ